MKNRRIIDAHSHIYPEKIAAKAVESINHFYDLDMACKEGTAAKLKEIAKEAGVVKVVISSVATTPKQVQSINNFILSEAAADSLFVPFATLHPDMTGREASDEYQRMKSQGIKGIKMHPDFQTFAIDGESAYKIFSELDGELPILLHTGDRRKIYSHPAQMVKAARDFPHLTFIAAHMGGWSEWEDAHLYQKTENVYFDTSSALAFMPPEMAVGIIDMLGEDRFLFGIDYPMWNYIGELERIEKLNLSERALDKIFFENANAVLELNL